MRGDPGRAVARAVLYEGYVLWPYRRSAIKNQRRWTFGGVHPRSWSDDGHEDDAWQLRTECLVRVGTAPPAGTASGPDEPTTDASGQGEPAPAPSVELAARFLQVVERRVARISDGTLDFADEIEVDGRLYVSWDEAREREIGVPRLPLEDGATAAVPVELHAASEREWLTDREGERAGAVVRTWRGLDGRLEVRCERLEEDLFRVGAVVSNTTDWDGDGRDDALRSTFAATHVVLQATGAEFVSLTDPPPQLADHAEACRNEGCWPVLLGEPGSVDTVLASPIILPDHPSVAPESPGDLFDGGEIDELLTLHILALTDEEREEMKAADPRTREILERTDALDREDVLRLHGTFRHPRRPSAVEGGTAPGSGEAGSTDSGHPGGRFWSRMEGRPPESVTIEGTVVARGSRVRLRPRRDGDVMDIALDGKVALVEGIDEDEHGGIHLTVAIEDDPGRDLGMARHPGHRFFFRPEEVEPLEAREPADGEPDRRPRSILVAGIGNLFLGDDGFGVEVAKRLAERPLPENVVVEDFGIRGLDLAYALDDHDVAILVDATPRGDEPGTIYRIDATGAEEGPVGVQTHGMDPARVLAFARAVGSLPERIYVVGCEPAVVPDPQSDEMTAELSPPVRAAVDTAVAEVEALIDEIIHEPSEEHR